jgi:ribonuclease Z
VRALLDASYAGVAFPVAWTPAGPGATLALGKGRTLEAFPVNHTASEPALGFRVVEVRQRLKPEFAGRPQAELELLARSSRRGEMMDAFRHIVFAHSGDAMPVPAEAVRGADLLVHDATFLDERDRREPIHASSREALAVARGAGVKALVLQHLSIRYDRRAAVHALREQVAASGFEGRVWLLDEAAWTELTR